MSCILAEIGIYRDNSTAIVIGDNNLLPIIVIAQNSFDLSITDISFVTYFCYRRYIIAINNSFCTHTHTQCSKLVSWRYGKNTLCFQSVVATEEAISKSTKVTFLQKLS